MVTQSWLQNLWTTLKKPEFHSANDRIAVLAFESASLMTKLICLWQSLTDKQVARLREEIANSVGVKNLVSENDEYIARLICAEVSENLALVAQAVARLSKKCHDPLLKSFEQAYSDLMKVGADTYSWQFSWKKMERKVKKMEQFIIITTKLYQEMEILADYGQTLKRMKGSDNADSIMLVEYEKKVAWKKQVLKRLKENSLWNRTYDYTILLLARSVFTIHGRIGDVFGVNHVTEFGVANSTVTGIHYSRRNHSTVFMQSSVYPFENNTSRFSSGASGKSGSVSGPLFRQKNGENFYSGPLGSPMPTLSPVSGKYTGVGFYSGPLGKTSIKSIPGSRTSKSSLKFWQFGNKSQDSRGKTPGQNLNEIALAAPFAGRAAGGHCPGDANSEVMEGTADARLKSHFHGASSYGDVSVVASKSKLLDPPPETLGATALALHYANVIVFIEKLVASPHLIGNDARDDLYNMLPVSIRTALRSQLKPHAKTLTASVYDTALAGEWNEAMLRILEWLSPLAHNMIKWQSERSFEHQSLVSRTNVLLVQTLYFANQEKTEAAITELLVGLNYIWRFGREINAKSLAGCASERTVDEYLENKKSLSEIY